MKAEGWVALVVWTITWLSATAQEPNVPKQIQETLKALKHPAATVKEVAEFQGHKNSVYALAFSPAFPILASAGGDQSVMLWDVDRARHRATLSGHKSVVWAIAFCDKGENLASQDEDCVFLWDTLKAKEKKRYNGPAETGSFAWVRSIAFLPTTSVIALGGGENNVWGWNHETNAESKILKGGGVASRDRLLSIPGKNVLAANIISKGNAIVVWNLTSRKQMAALEGQQETIISVAIAPDGKTLVSGGRHRRVRFWELESGKNTKTFSVERDIECVESLAYSPDGRLVAAGHRDTREQGPGNILLIDAKKREIICDFKAHRTNVMCLAFSADSNMLASGSVDGTIKLWDVSKVRREPKKGGQ